MFQWPSHLYNPDIFQITSSNPNISIANWIDLHNPPLTLFFSFMIPWQWYCKKDITQYVVGNSESIEPQKWNNYEQFKSICSSSITSIVNKNPNLITPKPLLPPCWILEQYDFKQGLRECIFKENSSIEPLYIYTTKPFTSTSSSPNVCNGNGNTSMHPNLSLCLWFMFA